MNTFLTNSYDLSKLSFTKPKKHGDFFICKVIYDDPEKKEMNVQFPKMVISSDPNYKSTELEFISYSGYNKEIYNFLSKIDTFIVDYISSNCEEWFGKKIPSESINQMYNKFIKAPKTSENKCTINFSFGLKKGEMVSSVVNKKNEDIPFTELKKGLTVECISKMKYIIFSKDSAFVNWEISTAKLYKKTQKVPKYGFVEDPDDIFVVPPESDEEIDVHSFF